MKRRASKGVRVVEEVSEVGSIGFLASAGIREAHELAAQVQLSQRSEVELIDLISSLNSKSSRIGWKKIIDWLENDVEPVVLLEDDVNDHRCMAVETLFKIMEFKDDEEPYHQWFNWLQYGWSQKKKATPDELSNMFAKLKTMTTHAQIRAAIFG
eukprot:UC4_evm7s1233